MTTLKGIIDAAEVEQTVDISTYTSYSAVRFICVESEYYSYELTPKAQSWRTVYPMQTITEIKFWKRLAGAKRYFLTMHGK